MNYKRHILVVVAMIIAGSFFSCFNDTAFEAVKGSGKADFILQHKVEWAKTVSSATWDTQFNGIAVGSDGIYAAGFIWSAQTVNFGNSVTATGQTNVGNVLLVKYNFDGVAQWARTLTDKVSTSDTCTYNSVAVGSDGVYAVGTINGKNTYTFAPGKTAAGGSNTNNVVIVKYSTAGVVQWAYTINSITADGDSSSFSSVAAGGDGIYAAGVIAGTSTHTVDFGNSKTATIQYGGDNVVLVKYDTNGTAQWAKTVNSNVHMSKYSSVAVGTEAAQDVIYCAGYIYGANVFDFGNSKTADGQVNGLNIILVKYNTGGDAQWARSIVDGDVCSFNAVAVGTDGIYAAGFMSSTDVYDFGNSQTVHGSYASGNALLVKYDSSGVCQWAKSTVTGGNYSMFNSVSAGSDGVYAAGTLTGDSSFSFGSSASVRGPYSGGDNIVLLKYGVDGTALWAQSVTSGSNVSVYKGVVAGIDGVYTAGYIKGSDKFGFDNYTRITNPWGNFSVLLAKYKL